MASDLGLKHPQDGIQGQGIPDGGSSMDRSSEARQPGVCMVNSTAGSKGTFRKQRDLDSSSDSASSLPHSGFGQLTTSLDLSILLSEMSIMTLLVSWVCKDKPK